MPACGAKSRSKIRITSRVAIDTKVMADDTELAVGEHTVLLLHPHWKILLRPTLVLVLVAVVLEPATLWNEFLIVFSVHFAPR